MPFTATKVCGGQACEKGMAVLRTSMPPYDVQASSMRGASFTCKVS